MAMPMGWDNLFGFVCAPAHSTYQNIKRERVFTVTYPRPTQVVLASLAATSRDDDNSKPALESVPTFPADQVDGRFVLDGHVFLECELDRMLDDVGRNSLLIGRIVAAQVSQSAMRAGDDDEGVIAEAPLLAYLQPGRFARISQSHSFPFPTEFRL
jgi:flavin reductase (DIM6/NTAB) family NADH-FMN oxidoreductase RutF